MKNKIILNKNEIMDILDCDYSNISNVISDKCGIVNAIMERYELEEYGLKMYQCLSADTRKLFGLSRDVSSGGLGISEEKKDALIGCIAEAIERYCMSYIPKKDLYRNCWKNIEEKHKVNNFYLYSDNQYLEYEKFYNPKKDEIYWVKVKSVTNRNDNDYIYWPASLVYLPYEIEKSVAELTSTGMAAGTTVESSIESGLLELIERDSLMINFKQRLNPPKIDLDTIDNEKIKILINKIKEKYNIVTYKLYSDLKIPTYLSYIWNGEGKKIHYGIGAATNLDSDIAIYKSLKECLFTYFYSKNIMDLRKTDKNKISTLYEHFLYYQGNNFINLLFDSETIEYKREVFTFQEILDDLKKNDINVYYKELTTKDIETTGLHVIRVIAVGLIDLNKTYKYLRLGANRFWDVPKKLGLKYNDDLSTKPHPFP